MFASVFNFVRNKILRSFRILPIFTDFSSQTLTVTTKTSFLHAQHSIFPLTKFVSRVLTDPESNELVFSKSDS